MMLIRIIAIEKATSTSYKFLLNAYSKNCKGQLKKSIIWIKIHKIGFIIIKGLAKK